MLTEDFKNKISLIRISYSRVVTLRQNHAVLGFYQVHAFEVFIIAIIRGKISGED